MPQEIFRQVTFGNGEIDPLMRGRRDTKNYYASLELAQNVITTPGGPLTQRPGTTFIDFVRHKLAAVDLTDDMVSAPAGGTAAAVAQDVAEVLVTTADLSSLDQVLLEVDFGQDVAVDAFDIISYAVKASAASAPPPAPPIVYPWSGIDYSNINWAGLGL